MSRILRVVSGGQTGIDIAALRAAKACGLETGGWMPKGWKTETGARPEYRDLYGMQQMASVDYAARTLANVAWPMSATLLLGPVATSPGMRCTIRATAQVGSFSYQCWLPTTPGGDIEPLGRDSTYRLVDSIVRWARLKESYGIDTINVAGNRGAEYEETAEEWLRAVFTALRATP